jgi:hypothetical protein
LVAELYETGNLGDIHEIIVHVVLPRSGTNPNYTAVATASNAEKEAQTVVRRPSWGGQYL